MATAADDKRIASLLPATLPLGGSEIIPLDQGGTTLRATAQDIVNLGKNVSAASRLLGRGSSAGSGVQQELTIDGTLQLTGTVLSVTPGTYGNAQTANPLSQFAATTSNQLAGVITDETGSGSLAFATAPTLINPVVGTQTAGNNTTLAASTAFVTAALGAGGFGNAQTANPLSQFAATTSSQFLGVISDETGTGLVVANNAPTLVNPVVGTQTAGNNTTLAASTAFATAADTALIVALKAAINVFTKNQSVTPTVVSSATGTYTADASTSNNFQLTLTGNLTLANPTNLTSGMVLNFTLDEDATGGRTITLGNVFKFPGGVVPTWTTTASAKNFFSGYYDGTIIRCGGGTGYA